MNHSQSTNLSGKLNTIISLNQPLALDSDYSNDDNSISICHEKFPSTSYDLSVSHEDFNLDLENGSVKEDVHIQTSYSRHYPLCPTIFNTSACGRDIPCSLVSSSNELSLRLRQGC